MLSIIIFRDYFTIKKVKKVVEKTEGLQKSQQINMMVKGI